MAARCAVFWIRSSRARTAGIRRQVHQREARVAQDRRQQVVEVVRDAARHQAQALELLGLADPFLQPAPLVLDAPLLGHVAHHGDHARLAAGGAVVDAAALEPAP